MKDINLLIIDDTPNEVPIANMCDELSLEKYQVCVFWMNPQDTIYQKGNRKESSEEDKARERREQQESVEERQDREDREQKESLEVDKAKFDKALRKMLISNTIHIVACDYHLGDDFATGVDVLAQIRDEFQFKSINILFSSKIDALLHEILVAENQGLKSKRNMLKKLIRSHSIGFPARDELAKDLKSTIRNTKFEEFNLRHEILKWLYAFQDHKFIDHPKFTHKSLGKIAQEIEDETPLGVDFQKIFIEQAISKMIKLNNLPPYI